MAEALAVIGSVASIMQLTGKAVKLMTRLRHFIRVLHKAPEEVESFLMETSIYTGMLNFFTELASRAMKTKGRKKQGEREKLVSNIKRQCKSICDKMANLVSRFAVLANGNLTRLENILERIKYILDKPDVTDLRLSVQTVSAIVNTLTTLFLLESSMEKKDDKTAILLEQVKNLLCTVKKANIELANHRQNHPLAYESGEPDNVMIDVSKEIQRQISSEIKSYSRFETAPDRRQRPRERRRDSSVIDRLDDQRRWASPSRRSGSDTESIGNLPQRPAYRTSFQSSSNAMERDAAETST
ncbi:hypothetical protein GGS24DRAFT_277201 [Hypoxylon argillaceum]|nr:hypothetical protein GGS24DRAFT_277201 [Hypoxylon argillaceum]